MCLWRVLLFEEVRKNQLVTVRKGRDLNPRVNRVHLPDFESGAVPSWATFPKIKIGETSKNPITFYGNRPD